MRTSLSALILVFLTLPALPAHQARGADWLVPVRGQSAQPQEPQFVDPQMTYTFGEPIQFAARLDPPQPVTTALISISTADRPGVFTDQARYDPATGGISYIYTVQPGALRPFSEVTYKFDVSLEDGSTLASPSYTATYADNRFDWQTRETPEVTVHWYQGGADFAQQAVDAARAGLIRIHEVLPVAPSAPPDVYIYTTPGDLQTALQLTGVKWVAGEASPELGAAFVSIPPSPEQRGEMERQIPHELAHLLHYQLAGAGWSNQPAWLREGIAANAELSPDPDYTRALGAAAAGGELIPLTELCAAFPLDASQAFLAYAEAESFVRYLRENYGASGLESLTRAYADRLGCEQGTQRAFGAPLTDLEQAWLAGGADWHSAQRPDQPAADAVADSAPLENVLPFIILLGLILIVPLAMALSRRR